jgi:hypothetical protein
MAARGDVISWARIQGRDFNQLCQAWAWQVAHRFGRAPKIYGSANQAYRASKIVSKDPSKAPGGAYHYWNLSSFGHVAPGTAPSECLMPTSHSGSAFTVVNEHAHLKLVRVFDYDRAHYLGWSYTNGANSFKLDVPAPMKPATAPIGHRMPAKTATALNGQPGTQGKSNCWIRVQVLASHGGYKGPWDGKLQVASWLGVQTYLKRLGLYVGDLDGKPKKLTYAALQRWAGVKNPTITDRWQNIAPANWRAIGKKLNGL